MATHKVSYQPESLSFFFSLASLVPGEFSLDSFLVAYSLPFCWEILSFFFKALNFSIVVSWGRWGFFGQG
jgi:hypothetical protein